MTSLYSEIQFTVVYVHRTVWYTVKYLLIISFTVPPNRSNINIGTTLNQIKV